MKLKPGAKVKNTRTKQTGVIKRIHPIAVTVSYNNGHIVEHIDPFTAKKELIPIRKNRFIFECEVMKGIISLMPALVITWDKETDIFRTEIIFVWLMFQAGFVFWRC